ncbi:MAG: TetR/AcrR family transcriptional regulator [Oscillospiraceae bacterium]|nr:TetR/AcrR family transcriptional regulator [Oscillospiraceae bacterium]
MKQQNARGRLIENTISVIAAEGLDKTTTKAIVRGTDINEAYIYRFFLNKDELLSRAFEELDNELLDTAMTYITVMYKSDISFENRCWLFFSQCWKFLLGNRDKCLAYIRYYYSPYYQKYSAISHEERFGPLVDRFKEAFRTEANVWLILNHILNVMLDFAIKVFDGTASNSDDTAEHVFRLIYFSVSQYFRTSEKLTKTKQPQE